MAQEGGLKAPNRHHLDWQGDDFWSEASLLKEMERVFDICAGCRRCFNLCNAFPTLFDAVDAAAEGEVSKVDHKTFWEVVDNCYLCDLCFMTKCPYVPPHPWNVDFPHLMMRGKAYKFKKDGARVRDKILTATDKLGAVAGAPGVAPIVNAANENRLARKALQATFGVHADAVVPRYYSNTARKQMARRQALAAAPESTESTRGKTAIFLTCYANRNQPTLASDLVMVLEHNGIPTRMTSEERCCGMPKLELGDFETIRKSKEANIPVLAKLVDEGWDILAPIPSCVLMFKQELPHLFPDEADVRKVAERIYDPFEYLMLRHKAGKLRTDFKKPLGKVMYHVPCHQRVQNIGLKTRQLLELVPETEVRAIERCSGHNGTYAVKREYHEISMKIGRPVMDQVAGSGCDHYFSDCPMAAAQIQNGLPDRRAPESPFQLLRLAYGI